ncbi:Aste57867_24178 [Aphanomyces stellatus]|uniref:Aste57867_24178 protein n=1 Tax=Aphanomyces stellatus TaxID=120398 RepID=A0A485LRI3_9STRA|nr:hypothetical protein As57867_024104 [Aphanomyces stellatus]VFU00820.1 Aste57867_24178 [Aphanomyces stellatus]
MQVAASPSSPGRQRDEGGDRDGGGGTPRHSKTDATHDGDTDGNDDGRAHSPSSVADDGATLRLFNTDSTDTLPCVHQLVRAHYASMRSLRHVLVPPPPPHDLQFESLSPHDIEHLTGPIRDVCETLTVDNCSSEPPYSASHVSLVSMVAPTRSNVHLMGHDVFYVSLYHGETMMMGIFFMPPNAVIPLHDHPYMSVVSRVLYGSVRLKAYSLVDAHGAVDDQGHPLLLAQQSRDKVLHAPCTMELSPSHHNVHELVADADIGCAVFDVMIPPYDDDHRHGNDYRVADVSRSDGLHVLQRIVKAHVSSQH